MVPTDSNLSNLEDLGVLRHRPAARLRNGRVHFLEKAIQAAEVDTTMSDEELAEAKARLAAWRKVDGELQEAIAVRKEAVVRKALDEAEA